MRSNKVLIVYNEPVLSLDHPDAESEHQILETVRVVRDNLKEGGFRVDLLGLSRDMGNFATHLLRTGPDVVFNLFEGFADQGGTEATVAGMLEWLRVPFTGCPQHTLALARNKPLASYLLKGAGLPTPEFFIVEDNATPTENTLGWPVIVKPALQDGSVGIDQGSVVTDQTQLNERVEYLLEHYGPPVMVQEFIQGREFNVTLIESGQLQSLPISEILFTDTNPGYWPIITYDAKWKPGSREFEATPPEYRADISPRLTERLAHLSKKAFRVLGCLDYARIDFRVKASGHPYILELNPNPDFNPETGLAGGLATLGMTHQQFTVDLVRNALARAQCSAVGTPVSSDAGG
jgi:D-alanine-D-alanine ligase